MAKSKEWSIVMRDEICQMKAVEFVEKNLSNTSNVVLVEEQFSKSAEIASAQQ